MYPKDIKKRQHIWKVANQYWIDWWYWLRGWDKPHFQDNMRDLTNNKDKMWFYKEIYQKENKNNNNKIIKDPEWLIKRVIENDKLDSEELIYAICIWLERVWKKIQNVVDFSKN